MLNLFGPLAAGATSAETVARACSCDPSCAGLLLDALTGLDLLRREADLYHLTPTAAAFFVPGTESYAGDWILAHTDPNLGSRMVAALRGEDPAFPPFPWAQGAWLESLRSSRPAASLEMWRLAGIEPGGCPGLRVLDLGCGCAIKSLVLACADATVRVTCIDRPDVLQVARNLAERLGVAGQVDLLAADLHRVELEPGRYSAALLGHVTDILSPAANLALFRRVRSALAPGGLLVLDVHLATPEPAEFPSTAAFLAWAIGGCSPYSFDDYRAWLADADYGEVRRLGHHWFSAARD